MDWDSFKKKEGIEEDLKIHNKGKDGYATFFFCFFFILAVSNFLFYVK
jgi:hypothetical protein